MFVLAVDEMCKEGVGELTCPYDTSSSSSESTPHVTMFTPTATQISTPTTVTTTSTASATATEKAITTIERGGDSNGDSESK